MNDIADTLIEGGSIASPSGVHPGNIWIKDGRIVAIVALTRPGESMRSKQWIAAKERIDATGCIVLPGLVDAHVHFREPGLTHKEDFGSGSLAAAVGGVTTVMVMPTDNPFTMNPEQFMEKRTLGEARSHVDFALQAGLGPDVAHVSALADLGACSFEIFMADLPSPLLVGSNQELVRCLESVASSGRVAGISPGDDSIVAARTRTDLISREASRRAFLDSRPAIAEAIGLARACVAARASGARIHIRQVSAAASVDVLRAFRTEASSNALTAEVTPHNLLLDGDEILRRGPIAKILPPLRSRADLTSVRRALGEGVIDIVATDHAPHLPEEKARGDEDLWKAPGGFPGVQTWLPLMLHLLSKGVLDYSRLVSTCCEAPARIFGLYPTKGALEAGSDADLVILDPRRPFAIRNDDQQSRARATPFDGWSAPASPVLTMLRGVIVAREGRPTGVRIGRFVRPS